MAQKSKLYVTAHGRTQSLADWARETGQNYSTLKSRITRGEKGEDIIFFERKDRGSRNALVTISGETKWLTEWANDYEIDRVTMYKRYEKGVRGTALLKQRRKNKNIAEIKQLCARCEKFWGGCNWSRNFTPVEGWTAKPTVICNKGSRPIDSYAITACPEFISDGR